jgi:hypothetical protein
MNRNELPKTYMGYSTAELLDILDKVSGGLKESLPEPPEKIIAMRMLAREYLLTSTAKVAAGILKFKSRTPATVN